MNEMTKTLALGATAVASVVLAWATRPGPIKVSELAEVGKVLFTDFKDPLQAKSLKIVKYDENLSKASEIEIRDNDGIWSLPSHEGYPADAQNRVRDAVTPFVDLKTLGMPSDVAADHSLYGVLEPSADKSGVGSQGVGTAVKVRDEKGQDLVDLIIGKEVKDQPGLRYVRRPSQTAVFVAKVDPTRLPVEFDQWIEKDLLKLNGWDIRQMVLKDYTFQVSASLRGPVTDFDQRLEMTVSDENGRWKLDELLVPVGNDLSPTSLGDNEEINQERLNGLKEALDQLEIVGVERKPSGLGEDLRADKGFFNNEAGFDSLLQRGFYPVRVGAGEDDVELLSSDGEALVRTKEGVEYVLRFGRVQGVDSQSADGKLNRYLLVSARVDQSQFPEPELEKVPESVEDLKPLTSTVPPAAVAEPANGAAEPAPAGDATTEPAAAPASGSDPPASDTPVSPDPAGDVPAASEAAPSEATPTTPETGANRGRGTETRLVVFQESAPPVDTPVEPATDANGPGAVAPANSAPATEASVSPPGAPPVEQDPAKRLQAERERVTRDNQRKIDERKDKLSKAEKKVRELNYRFADWYYVISEDVYKKIHLSQTDVIKEKAVESEEQGFGVDALRGLEQRAPNIGQEEPLTNPQ